jgi:hypothetical protein
MRLNRGATWAVAGGRGGRAKGCSDGGAGGSGGWTTAGGGEGALTSRGEDFEAQETGIAGSGSGSESEASELLKFRRRAALSEPRHV